MDVDICQRADGAVTVIVRNDRAAREPTRPAPPGSGTGLIGLAERVALAGGGLDHGPTPDGGYALNVSLPVPQ